MLMLPCIVAGTANAHIVGARLGDFYAGALHPLTDLQDVLLWIGVGLLAGLIGADRGRWLVAVVPAGLVAGLSLAVATGLTAIPAVASAAVMVVIGLMIAAGLRLGTLSLALLAGGLAMLRGADNAAGLAADTDRLLFAAGLATMGYVAITLTMALTVVFLRGDANPAPAWRRIAVRVCGSWIAAIGLMVGGLALVS